MNHEQIIRFRDVLITIADKSPLGWVYLPIGKVWNLDSESVILESDEVPPKMEDDPDAGIPEFARRNNFKPALDVSSVQDIVFNARSQKPNATLDDLFRAFQYYRENDAFIELE